MGPPGMRGPPPGMMRGGMYRRSATVNSLTQKKAPEAPFKVSVCNLRKFVTFII
jgi:hypothetical protein